jgi:hypothetical protein
MKKILEGDGKAKETSPVLTMMSNNLTLMQKLPKNNAVAVLVSICLTPDITQL